MLRNVPPLEPDNTTEPVQTAAIPERIGDSLPCLTCRYDLTGLAAADACPECATPILYSYHGTYSVAIIERQGLARHLRRAQVALTGAAFGLAITALGIGVTPIASYAFIVALACCVWWLVEWSALFIPHKHLAAGDAGSRFGMFLSLALIAFPATCFIAVCSGLASSDVVWPVLLVGHLVSLTLHQHLALQRIRYFASAIEPERGQAGLKRTARIMDGLALAYLLITFLSMAFVASTPPLLVYVLLAWYPAIAVVLWIITLERLHRRIKHLLLSPR